MAGASVKIFTLILVLLALYSAGQCGKLSTCEVAKMRTQRNFNLSEFMGEWHVISDVEIFPHQHKLDKIVDAFTNIKLYGVLRDSHQVEVTVVTRVLGICMTTRFTAERPDFKTPSKLEVSNPDAWWSYLKEPRPVWIVWTDGEAALLYSCGKELEDGTCDPHHTHSWTMSRSTEGHTQGQLFFINEKLTELCINSADFKDMKTSWPCAEFDVAELEEEDDEDDDDTKEPEADQEEAETGADDREAEGGEDAEGEEDGAVDEEGTEDEEDLSPEDEAEEGDEGEEEEDTKSEL